MEFCQDKIISTGGEGMFTTNNEKFYKYVLSYKDHGKNFDLISRDNKKPGFKWLHESIGTNMRLTEMQSVIGRNQIKKLEKWNKLRERNAMILFENLSQISSLRIPMPGINITHAWYRFYFYLNPKYLLNDWDRERIILEIKNRVSIFLLAHAVKSILKNVSKI